MSGYLVIVLYQVHIIPRDVPSRPQCIPVPKPPIPSFLPLRKVKCVPFKPHTNVVSQPIYLDSHDTLLTSILHLDSKYLYTTILSILVFSPILTNLPLVDDFSPHPVVNLPSSSNISVDFYLLGSPFSWSFHYYFYYSYTYNYYYR